MFQLQNLVPIPLQDQIADSQVWGCSLRLEAPKRYFIYAPSGKGKTTLQHVLYGLRKDYSGALLLDVEQNPRDINELGLDAVAALRQRSMAVIFQDLRLFLPLTARENILLKNELTQHYPTARIEAMAERLEIKHLLDRPCEQLSYGQRQRVAIIRALCQPFRFLLMDEPFSHLDVENIRRCCALIQEVCTEQNAGFLVASLGERYFFEYDVDVRL